MKNKIKFTSLFHGVKLKYALQLLKIAIESKQQQNKSTRVVFGRERERERDSVPKYFL